MTTQSAQTINISQAVSEALWLGLGSLVSIIVGCVFWLFGANWTVRALIWICTMFWFTPGNGPLWMAMPLLFSAIELAAWKRKHDMTPRVRGLAQCMTGLDMGSTIFGLGLAIFVGQSSALNMVGITDPAMWMYGVGAGVAMVFGYAVTIYPERLILDGVLQLWQVGRLLVMVSKMKKGSI